MYPIWNLTLFGTKHWRCGGMDDDSISENETYHDWFVVNYIQIQDEFCSKAMSPSPSKQNTKIFTGIT